jgi:hypothetical protein
VSVTSPVIAQVLQTQALLQACVAGPMRPRTLSHLAAGCNTDGIVRPFLWSETVTRHDPTGVAQALGQDRTRDYD